MPASVLIVDDHAGFRLSARRVLEADGYTIVGEAENGRAAIAASRRLRPDIVLLDVNLPDLDGFAVARELAAEPDAPAIVLTSSHDSEDFGDSVPRSRAAGFVPKDELCGAAVAALVA
jgi:DNA-binding NarL/FixJ family response regulator